MNILIKLTCLIGLVIAPILGGHLEETTALVTQEVELNISIDADNSEHATVSISNSNNEKEVDIISN